MKTAQKGFTLAELLIALALLGIIAAFTIPKVLQASQTQEATAKIREAVSTLEQAWYSRRMQNTVLTGAGQRLYTNIQGGMNTLTQGAGDVGAAGNPLNAVAAAHPCTTNPLLAEGANVGFLQFNNGVLVTGLSGLAGADRDLDNNRPNDPAANHDGQANYVICIDYNGAANPNQPGIDVFIGNFNQYGGFNAANFPVANLTETSKSFNWGGPQGGAIGVYDTTAAGAFIGGANGIGDPAAANPTYAGAGRLMG